MRGDRFRQRAVYSAGNYRLGILRQLPLLFTVIELLGALYLLWIGSLLVRSRPQTLTGTDAQSTCRVGKQILLGLGSSLLNPKKCAVLSGANDRPARPVGDAAATNHERDLDDQHSAVLGSADRDVHRFTADPATVIQRDIMGRTYRWRCIDYLRLCHRSAVLQSIVV